ncbi:MAG: hypothetical protein LBU69_00215, partial [Deltaproteobacteria bacterium]|nr:hypothetical protein [Deltaproteobacteria bacterium]
MKTHLNKLAILLVPAIFVPFLASGCINEFMLAAQYGYYDPYSSEYDDSYGYAGYDSGSTVVIENTYYETKISQPAPPP